MNFRPLSAGLVAAVLVLTGCAQLPSTGADAGTTPAAPAPVKVMVLGVYHFDNPGLDLNNIETDNVLSAQRQGELDALGRALATFQPTVVAVERVSKPPYVDPAYEDFTVGDLQTVPGEDVQIGYRVARLAGLDKVYAINEQTSAGEPNYFPYGAVADFAERHGESDELDAMADISGLIDRFEAYQKTWTIPALLKLQNTGYIPDDFYWDIIRFGEGEDQPGAELAAYWFMRNTKIFNKLQQVTAPGDRVLVVFGSGHKSWLEEIVTRANGYESVDPVPYLDRAIADVGAGHE